MKILITGLLFIVLISTASSHTSSQGSTIPYLLQAYVTKSGNITLSEDALGFTAPIDMSDHFSEASDGTTTFSMAISLYSSDTFFARNCMTLFSFYCAEDNLCTQHTESPFSANYVQFVAKGYYISTPAYLDYDHWTLNNQAGYATSCISNIPLPYGNGRYGILGMGLGNGSQTNYLSSKVFSVNLNRTATRGGLVFHSQPVEFPSYTQVATLQTDENWNVIINSDSGAAITIGDNTYVFQANLILDMNSDLIGFPLTVYSYVIDFLQKNASMNCTDADYEPVCVYTGSTSNLPNMTLVVQQQKIQIPPYIYVQNFYTYSYQNGTFSLTLNIRKISSTLTGESYVSPYFENYVILDMNFLFNYIAVFNATNGFQITLYAPPYTNNNIPPQPGPAPTPSSNSHNNTAIHIIIGVVGFVMIVVAVFCVVRVCRRKRRQMNLDEESSYDLQNDEQTFQQRNIDPTMPPQVQQFYPQNYSQGNIQVQNQYYPVNQGQLSGNYINPQS